MTASDRSHGGAIVAGTIAVLLNMALLSLIPRQPVALPVTPMQLVFVIPRDKPRPRPLDGVSRDATRHHPEQSPMRSVNNRESERKLQRSALANVSATGSDATVTPMAPTPDQTPLSANTGSTLAGHAGIGGDFQDNDPLHLRRRRAMAAARKTVHLRLRPEMSLSLLGQRKYCAYLRGLLLGTDSDRKQAFTGPTTKEGVFTAMQNSGCITE